VPGTIRKTPLENGAGIVVECEEVIDPYGNMYGRRGVMIMVHGNTRRVIWSVLRTPRRAETTE